VPVCPESAYRYVGSNDSYITADIVLAVVAVYAFMFHYSHITLQSVEVKL